MKKTPLRKIVFGVILVSGLGVNSFAAQTIKKSCTFKSSPTNAKMAKGPHPILLKSNASVYSANWAGNNLDNVQYDSNSNVWLATAQLGTVKIMFAKNVVTVKNEMSGVTGFYVCADSLD